MFGWFKKESAQDKVIEEQREQLDSYLKNTTPEPERTYLSIGPTSKNRVSLRIHYGEVTMDLEGIDSLIKTLEASKAWIVEKEEDELL